MELGSNVYPEIISLSPFSDREMALLIFVMLPPQISLQKGMMNKTSFSDEIHFL